MSPRAFLPALVLLLADIALLVATALLGSFAAARASPSDLAPVGMAALWLAAAFGSGLLAAGLVLRMSWTSTAHALGYLALAAGAAPWVVGPGPAWLHLTAQAAAFLVAALALAPSIRHPPAARPETGEATAVPATARAP